MARKKKLVLASLVSLIMVLAFAVGVVPWPGSLRATVSAGDGRINVVKLLDLILDAKADVTEVAITYPPEGSTVVIPAGGDPAELTVVAEPNGDTAGVTFAANQPDNIFDAANAAPYKGILDLRNDTLVNVNESNTLYAFADIIAQAAKAYVSTTSTFFLNESASDDTDGDGFPDDPFGLPDGAIWVSTTVNGAMVAVADLGGADDTCDGPVTVHLNNITVSVPCLADLAAAGDIYLQNTFAASLVVVAAPDLATLVGADTDMWVDPLSTPVIPLAPVLPGLNQMAEISIVYSFEGGIGSGVGELDVVPTGEIQLTIDGIDLADGSTGDIYMFGTDMAFGPFAPVPADPVSLWTELVSNTITGGQLAVVLPHLSVFAPFSADAAEGEGEGEGELDITPDTVWTFGGVVARIAGANLDAATAVYVGGAQADIISSSADELLVVIPPSAPFVEANSLADVTIEFLEKAAHVYTNAMTYVHFTERTESFDDAVANVATTAFTIESGEDVGTIYLASRFAKENQKLALDLLESSMTIPGLTDSDPAYVLVRTAATPAAVFGLDDPFIDQTLPVSNTWSFDVHIYRPSMTAPTPVVGAMAYVEDSLSFAIDNPAIIEMPIPDDVNVLESDVNNGNLYVYGMDTDLAYSPDYTPVADTTPVIVGGFTPIPPEAIESQVAPADITTVDRAGEMYVASVGARVYSLSAFELRLVSDDCVAPGAASNPNPADEAIDVPLDSVLSWTAGALALSHEVYFGTTNPPPFVGEQAGTTFDPGTMLEDTVYYWQINEKDLCGVAEGEVWSFTTEIVCPAPGAASNPDPADMALNVPVTAALSWTAGSLATSHSVYFGTVNPPPFVGTQAGTTFDPAGEMAVSTTYYWKVVENNECVGTTAMTDGPVWMFTTEGCASAAKATNPSPANAAIDVILTPTLTWTAGALAASHNVYFGTTNPPIFVANQAAASYVPGTLDAAETYFWRIDEVNACGVTTGDVWSFTTKDCTLPTAASNPNPANGATDVDLEQLLTWTAGTGATTHNVYFGTSATPPFQGSQVSTTFDPGTLTAGVTYYWRIDEMSDCGLTTGTVWSFTTCGVPGQATNPDPTNGKTKVSVKTDLSWDAGANATSHDVYFGTDPAALEFRGNQTGTTYDPPGKLLFKTTYYWRVDEVSNCETTTGELWSFTTQENNIIVLSALVAGALALLGIGAGGGDHGGGGPCFIATAAYGSPMADEIDTLRSFRDTYLLTSAAGVAFSDTYYRVSPWIADIVAQSPWLAAVVRVLLTPIIFAASMPHLTVALLLVAAAFIAVRRWKRGRV